PLFPSNVCGAASRDARNRRRSFVAIVVLLLARRQVPVGNAKRLRETEVAPESRSSPEAATPRSNSRALRAIALWSYCTSLRLSHICLESAPHATTASYFFSGQR